MKFTISFLFVLLLFSCTPETKQPLPPLSYTGENPRIQNPLSPEESQKHIQLPDGFTAELFAAEPNIINPIAMTWDERGRLWVVQSMDYPHELENEVGGDRITICEDTDGDGKADKFTDFATEQSLTTGIVKVKGGVIVAQAPNMVFLEDTDGDDMADKSEILFGGFGIWDTHAGPSSLKYGFDNKIWGAVGYSGFENDFEGKTVKFTRGVYRFSKDGSYFEPLGQFNNNTWGLGISGEFEIFGSTANNNHACYVGIPLRHYDYLKELPSWAVNSDFIQGHYEIHPVDTVPLQQVDVRGGYTAAAGANFYLADNYPRKYKNQMYVNAPTGHLVHIANMIEEGGGFQEVDGGNIFASTDAWTAPVFTETGPDGNLWVADWYNPVIQHNPDARGMDNQIWNDIKGEGNAHLNEHRDKKHGRIYVIKYQDKVDKRSSLDPSDVSDLLNALRSENVFWRTTAQRLLVENDHRDALPELLKLAEKSRKGEQGTSAHALFSYDGLNPISSEDSNALEVLEKVLSTGSRANILPCLDLIPKSEVGSELLVKSGLLEASDLIVLKKAILTASELPETPKLYDLIERIKGMAAMEDKWIKAAVNIYMKVQNIEYIEEADVAMIIPSAEDEDVSWEYSTTEPSGDWHTREDNPENWSKSKNALGTLSLNPTIGTEFTGDEIWIRRVVDLSEGLKEPVLKILHDEDYKIYVNGNLVAEGNGYNNKHELLRMEPGTANHFKNGRNVIAGYCKNTNGAKALDFGFGYVKGFTPDKVFELSTVPQKMAYDQTKIYAMAGDKIELRLNNIDEMPHNLVLIDKGSLENFGKIVDQFLLDPKAADSEYLPKSRYILGATEMLEPTEKGVIQLTLPEEPGVYPFICTFPGHWRMMQGELIVSPRGSFKADVADAPKVLIKAGGSSHNFLEFFGVDDGRIMSMTGQNEVYYTENSDSMIVRIEEAELVVISNNKPFNAGAKQSLFEHVNKGKSLFIYHPSAWYNWTDWPEYNRDLVGGGSRSHEKLQEFEVKLVNRNHAITKGLPKTFRIKDELYRFEKDPQGSAIQVLAVGRGLESGKEYPVLWIVNHPNAKILVNTLGHDDDAHSLPAYQQILENALKWALPQKKTAL